MNGNKHRKVALCTHPTGLVAVLYPVLPVRSRLRRNPLQLSMLSTKIQRESTATVGRCAKVQH